MTLQDCSAHVLTVSDRCHAGTREDLSGPAIVRLLHEAGLTRCTLAVVPDERAQIAAALRNAAGVDTGVDLIVTTGGTGVARRDVTPEATQEVCTRLVPGLAETMRAAGAAHTPFAPLARGVCGILDGPHRSTLVVNLPGSTKGAVESLRSILPVLGHALELLAGQTDHVESSLYASRNIPGD